MRYSTAKQATHAHSQYAIIIAFPLQQWLHEHSSMLRYTQIARLVKTVNHMKTLLTPLLKYDVDIPSYL